MKKIIILLCLVTMTLGMSNNLWLPPLPPVTPPPIILPPRWPFPEDWDVPY
jgi:hypothetical protein